jgi:hypothetical protein
VDQCFREALLRAELGDKTFVACAYTRRIQRYLDAGLFASCVVPFGVPPKAAPVRRSVWMVQRASVATHIKLTIIRTLICLADSADKAKENGPS